MTVWFTEEYDAVSKAQWTDNGFDYVVCLTGQTVSADIMTDYVLSIR